MRIPLLHLRPWCLAATAAAALTVAAPVRATAAIPRQDRAEAQAHDRFDDHDRQNVKDWYEQHRQAPPAGLRDRDRLDEKSHVVVGKVLDPDLRKQAYAVPTDLRSKLPAPPKGDRYYLIDGQLCLVDGSFAVRDTIQISGR